MTETLEDMVEWDLADRGIKDARVLAAFRKIDRKLFVPKLELEHAYNDRAVYLSHGQTLSQPYIVGLMTQSLKLTGSERVLEVGTGSGFQTAILSTLAKEVYTIERIEFLATTAEDRLLDMGIKNAFFKLGDGSEGWAEKAPFDRIIMTAACPRIPPKLVEQLAEGGILSAPVGPADGQNLVTMTKKNGQLQTQTGVECIFVKLVGTEGYKDAAGAPMEN